MNWLRLPEIVEHCLRLRGITTLQDISSDTGIAYQCVRSVFKKQKILTVGIVGEALATIMNHYNITPEELTSVWALMKRHS
jgi:hypothetical protein